jgi:hypothetical protein
MKIATAQIEGVSPYSQSRHYDRVEVPPLQGENNRDYESRTWRNRLHVNADGYIQIPPMSFKLAITEAAKYLSIKVPGGGKQTYTKNFEAGILTTTPIVLPLLAKDCASEVLFVPSDGRRGSGSRVEKVFPLITKWGGTLPIMVFDEATLNIYDVTTKKSVLQYVLEQAGMFIGVGRFRPKNNGFYGRFAVKKFSVSEG